MRQEQKDTYLFVYGTLYSSYPESRLDAQSFSEIDIRELHALRSLLQKYGALETMAYCNGILADAGGYPGLWLSDKKEDIVRGELWNILEEKAPALFQLLDEYEGVHEREKAYARTKLELRSCEDGHIFHAWAYVYNEQRKTPCKLFQQDYFQETGLIQR